MRPPIPTGSILQTRYRILSVLGQGGFGRTYLAEDQGRFNELCALKELIPAQGGAYALDKSKELFQREAQILYQIQHPQIPQFRATFEEDQRLFLVQDYVEGQTYRTLLEQRQVQGLAFSEAEVLQLIRQLLPVLAHIHSKGIIHRDIAPDNIMLRQQDGKPVLIDFGVVKELATRFQSPNLTTQNTTVGKPGFAPSEQMQSGRAYPSSDLYSLAVTAVVLLTGREPQTLFDDTTLTWYWQRWVTVSPGFAQVLNKMLSYRPGDRFQSVADVVQALQSPIPATYTQPPYQPQPPVQTAPPPDVSHMATMAVGRRPDPLPVTASPNPAPVVPAPRSSIWDDPLAVVAIGLGLVVLTGVGTWAVVRAVLNNQPTPTPTPTITTSFSPTPTVSLTPTPKPTNTPVTYSQDLNISPDTKVTKTGSLRSNETVTYILAGEQGQQLNAVISGEGVLMSMLGPDRQPLPGQSSRVSLWQGALPYTGNYYIQLSPVKGLDKSDYRLDVSLRSAATPSPTPTTPTPTPSPSPTAPTVQRHRVRFEAGQTATTVSDRATPLLIHRYVVRATEGQIFKAAVRDGAVTLNITAPDGQPIQAATNVLSWEDQLPMSGAYQIDVIATQETTFSLDISVRN